MCQVGSCPVTLLEEAGGEVGLCQDERELEVGDWVWEAGRGRERG